MDISEEYINMCMNALEIQDYYAIPRVGDFISVPSGIEIVLDYNHVDYKSYTNNDIERRLKVYVDTEGLITYEKGDFIWLPRQDQLLEIMGKNKYTIFVTEGSPNFLISYKYDEIKFTGNSLEQILLKKVMKEKFNKEWENDEWKII